MRLADAPQTYTDPREERREWQAVRATVEAEWLRTIRSRLRKGPALTSELAEAAGVMPGKQYSRFLSLLRKHARVVDQRVGPSKHLNKVWEMAA